MGKTKLLFVGDVHLGRRPGRVPAEHALATGPRAAFKAVVEEAISRRVRAVVFLGDVVDSEDHFLEAYSALERGLRRLIEGAGVEVYAVAGNHDVRALPKLADEVPGFHLLGREGRWEEHVLDDADGNPAARLVAWSFPRRRVDRSPLDAFPGIETRTDIPTIGLLHADLDAHTSTYAPVPRRDLEAVTAVDAWLLGHVHAPSHAALTETRPVGYLGSLVGLRPTETGAHGPWELTLDGGTGFHLQQLAIAPLVWARIDVPVEDIEAADDLDVALAAALRDHATHHGAELGTARVVGCRLRLVGSSARHRELAARAARLDVRELRLERDGRHYFVDRLVDAARPALDLEGLARGEDPPGLLAGKLLALERGEPAGDGLVRKARERLRRLGERPPWGILDAEPPTEEAVRVRLRRAGERALEELLVQRRERP